MKQKVIIVGAGFAGIQLARKLNQNAFEVLIIDKLNHHQFQPLFYQVATAQIEPSSISFPLRSIFKRQHNVDIRLAEVLTINCADKFIETSIGPFNYDILVVATGCKSNFYGNQTIEQNAFTLKSTYEAINIRNHILTVFEDVASLPDAERDALQNLVIVGAGPTGVEMAGAFAEIKMNILPKDYPKIDFSKFNIILVEGSKSPLNHMSGKSKQASVEYLNEMGVTLKTETLVKAYDGHTLTLTTGETIATKTVIWAAGVTANFLDGLPLESRVAGNRIKVNRQNKVAACSDVYAIGDVSLMETPKYPKGHPQLANVAINQAKNLARNLNAMLKGGALKDYEYIDLGSMATIGEHKAVIDIRKVNIKGYFAWLIWMFLHLMLILSVKNKLIIFINWAWAYITKDTSLRLILRPLEAKQRNVATQNKAAQPVV